jgi:L-ribulose-5-phosphate 4-epimerase
MEKLIQETLQANLELLRHQLVILTWGNVSVIDREQGLVAIKSSGVPYDQMEARYIVVLNLLGQMVSGTCRPSSDTATHLELYRQIPSIGSVVHTHSRWATIWAQADLDLPAYGTTHADSFYGTVPCTRHLTQLEIEVDYERNTGVVMAETFTERGLDPLAMPGVLVSGHGPFTWGRTAREAVDHAIILEECAMMAWHAKMLNPGLTPMDQALLDRHYLRKHGQNAYYGQK